MRNTIKVSIAIHKGYTAIVFVYKGKKIHSVVKKKDASKSTNQIYLELLKESLLIAQSIVKNTDYVDDDNWDVSELIIDIRCSPIIGWIHNKNSKGSYTPLFLEVLRIADEIVIPYKLINKGATLANTFANPKYIEKESKYEPVSFEDLF